MKLLETLNGYVDPVKPVWMMRQAGRYLPEYKKLRSNFKGFIDFCFNSEAVVEATLQPIKRFDLDAAIIFSDILVIPHCLGQNVNFVENVGPVLDELENLETILDQQISPNIATVYESITKTRQHLAANKALIGFAGCPWTVASYMLGYNKTKGFQQALLKAQNISNFEVVLTKLAHHIADHCINQINAGANVIQLFESWASVVPVDKIQSWVFSKSRLIIEKIRNLHPNVPIIYFAKGRVIEAMQNLRDLNIAFSVDENTNLFDLPHTSGCLQGNLSPLKLVDGNFEGDVVNILNFAKDKPFVVNLGHGILPHTPIENVEKFIHMVRFGN